MKVSAYHLLDPQTGNNQCHLYTALVVRMAKREKTAEERVLCDLILRCSFYRTGRGSIRDDQKALTALFESMLKTDLGKESDALHKELAALAHREELRCPLYTYPKLAGVAYLIGLIAREKIDCVVKVLFITDKGSKTFVHHAIDYAGDPVAVFETLACEDKSTSYYMTVKDECPHSFFPSSRKKHGASESCGFCKGEADSSKAEEVIRKIAFDELLYGAAADFMFDYQKDLGRLMTTPELKALTLKAFKHRREHAIGRSLQIIHVYPDSRERALDKTILQMRKL